MRVGLGQLLGKLGKSAGSRKRLPEDSAARLQDVYDRVLREVVRSGQDRPVREVEEILVARLRQAFPAGLGSIRSYEDQRSDAEHLARRKRVVL
jgi:hypothetical protein